MKHLHKFYNKVEVPWVHLIWDKYYSNKVPHASREIESFWWRDVLRLNGIYRTIASCKVVDGSTVCFWEDNWSGMVLSNEFPRLFYFAINEAVSVQGIIQAEDLDDVFFLPLSVQAFDELQLLQDYLSDIQYDEDVSDTWEPIWGSRYTSKKFYNYAYKEVEGHSIFKLVWKSRCTPRVKFFARLVLVDRLNTKVMLRRRHLNTQDDPYCVMCNVAIEEDIEHLFFSCPFAQDCWISLGFNWDMSFPLQERFLKKKEDRSLPFFMEVAIIGAWELWKLRNDKIFQRQDPTYAIWLANFKNQCLAQSVRFKDDLRSSFCFWLDAFS
jgi:hypothetical protein